MTLPLDRLVADLRDLLEPRSPVELDGGPAGLLRSYAKDHDDWRRYAFFEDGVYTRNLIEANPAFELILLCWPPGQHSPVHNHEGQDCWMTILEGAMEEERFELPTTPGPLVSGSRKRFRPGEVAFIRDEIGLHIVRPLGPAPSVTLHLYAAPIPECNCYCERTGAISRRRLSFHTVRGERVLG